MYEPSSSIAAGQPPLESVPAGPVTDIQKGGAPLAANLSVALPVRPRLWPATVCIVLMWVLLKVPVMFVPGSMLNLIGVVAGPAVGVLGFFVCWLFFSRIPWRDRFLGIFACGLACAAACIFCEPDFIGLPLALYAPPIVASTWLSWFLITPFLSWPVRRVGMVVALGLVWSYFPLLRWIQVDGTLDAVVEWRFLPSDESTFLSERPAVVSGPMTIQLKLKEGDWPGYRGPKRDGRLQGVRINPDWDNNPPTLLWKQRIGKGWSSFAVVGKHVFTQYQLDKDEAVGCFDADTGKELWTHTTPGRFKETMGGIGPRATPTFSEGKIFAVGALGTLDCLDATNGQRIWSRNFAEDAGASVPKWGFASSPLVVQGIVIVYAGGPSGNTLLCYDAESGKKLWSAGEGQHSYSSPHPAKLEGVDQVLLATEKGLAGYKFADGDVLWKYDWPTPDVVRCVQPGLVDERTVLLGTGMGIGTRKVNVRRSGDRWEADAAWTTRAIKPYYNDLVIHKGYAYGFDSKIFKCIDLEDGTETWHHRGDGDGYGLGQTLLLADQDLLLIVSERGEVSLLKANPSPPAVQLPGRFQAVKGITWNHPVVAHGRLFVRSCDWMACYELAK